MRELRIAKSRVYACAFEALLRELRLLYVAKQKSAHLRLVLAYVASVKDFPKRL